MPTQANLPPPGLALTSPPDKQTLSIDAVVHQHLVGSARRSCPRQGVAASSSESPQKITSSIYIPSLTFSGRSRGHRRSLRVSVPQHSMARPAGRSRAPAIASAQKTSRRLPSSRRCASCERLSSGVLKRSTLRGDDKLPSVVRVSISIPDQCDVQCISEGSDSIAPTLTVTSTCAVIQRSRYNVGEAFCRSDRICLEISCHYCVPSVKCQ